MVVVGRTLVETFGELCRMVEELSGDCIAAVLTIEGGESSQRSLPGPRFPGAFLACIDGIEIGPNVGSCGTAAYRKEQVIVDDISVSPLWSRHRELALSNGFRASWSTPIIGSSDNVLGIFAIYWHEPRSPTPRHYKIISHVVRLASLVIQRKQAAESFAGLRDSGSRTTRCPRSHALETFARESDPDKLLAHVLRTIIGLMVAEAVGVWERDTESDYVERIAAFEGGRFLSRDGTLLRRARISEPGPGPRFLEQDSPRWPSRSDRGCERNYCARTTLELSRPRNGTRSLMMPEWNPDFYNSNPI